MATIVGKSPGIENWGQSNRDHLRANHSDHSPDSRTLSNRSLEILHDEAVPLRPETPLKLNSYWVAVLPGSKIEKTRKTESDFLWIKCHSRVTLQKIHDQYAAYRQRNSLPGAFTLICSGKISPSYTTVQELDLFGDKVIAFAATEETRSAPSASPASGMSRSPLMPAPKGPNIGMSRSSSAVNPPVLKSNVEPSPSIASPTYHAGTPTMSGPRPYLNGAYQYPIPSPPLRSMHSASVKPEPAQTISPTWGTNTVPPCHAPSPYEAVPYPRDPNAPLPYEDGPYPLEPDAPYFNPYNAAQNAWNGRHSHPSRDSLARPSPLSHNSWDHPGSETPFYDAQENSHGAQNESLKTEAKQTRTIVGVVGNTGAGKSSVINAMLDEERLVPTNCMRACTAVVTEISYNDSEEAGRDYRAEIEFIGEADWEKELNVLFQELVDADGKISRECTNQDTEAGIAYAKIRAVYPKKTKDDLASSSVDALMKDNAVKRLLGTTKRINSSDPAAFYRDLQQYVDSKEKNGGSGKDKAPRETEFWPLIRVVKIYTKSPALETGAVIVDLPGVHDSNAARAAVAEGYMKQCTGLWIVAPINRAVDDKAAKNLLGESFKRQLKMDGGFSSVTFICSKTDDISLVEATDSLGLEEANAETWAELDGLDAMEKELKATLKELRETKSIYKETMDSVDLQIEDWERLEEKYEEGDTVFAPSEKSSNKKRKRPSNSKSRQRKKSRDADGDDDTDSFIDDADSDDAASNNGEGDLGDIEKEAHKPLTADEIDAKLADLKATKKEARKERLVLDNQIKEVNGRLNRNETTRGNLEADLSAVCIAGRNAYSKGAIQHDFAAGIKELDQELAVEEDEELFNPDEEIRDYEQVAQSLPVFCVSSRGYQKLKGRLRKDPAVPGFTAVEETEIPALQAHCRKLTEKGRMANCRRFMYNLSQLLNSMSLWSSAEGSGANMTESEREKESRDLRKKLNKLHKGLEKAVETCMHGVREEIGDNIFDVYDSAISNAERNALPTAMTWGAPINRENRSAGGIHWSTYRAICRRDGLYAGSTGKFDFNGQLVEPLIKVLTTGWEKTFVRRIPAVMSTFSKSCGDLLKAFHKDIDKRARKHGTSIASLQMLLQQMGTYEAIFKDLAVALLDRINAEQREINREFTPVICAAMETAYSRCVEERGTGSFARMKQSMMTHIESSKDSMFRDSADEVRRRLGQMKTSVEEQMANKVDEVSSKVKKDYLTILGGYNSDEMSRALSAPKMPHWEQSKRVEIGEIVEGAGKVWEELLDGKSEESGPMDDADAGASHGSAEATNAHSPAQVAQEERINIKAERDVDSS
ncbi:MAG: Protein kinase C signaling pathway involved MAPKK protein [Chaenotheca gracillima]|nr:MAG: Protein kinase C signaling pathway involved MAPKK protein [Chaenotheca gracillima]